MQFQEANTVIWMFRYVALMLPIQCW